MTTKGQADNGGGGGDGASASPSSAGIAGTIATLERRRVVAEAADAYAAAVCDDRGNRSGNEIHEALAESRAARDAYHHAIVAAAPNLISIVARAESLRAALAVDLGRADRDAIYRHDLKALAADGGAASCHTDVGTAVAGRMEKLRIEVARLREALDGAGVSLAEPEESANG